MSTITAEKAALRRRVRAYLEGLSPRQRRESDDALFARFLSLPQVEAADTLLLYHGMGAEPDTARLFPALWARGKRLCLPRCLPGHGMEARLIRPDSALVPHRLGMLEPGEDCPPVDRADIGLVLVPGLAFDRSGGRLARGAGTTTAGWPVFPASPPPCAAPRCYWSVSPRRGMISRWPWCSPRRGCTARPHL